MHSARNTADEAAGSHRTVVTQGINNAENSATAQHAYACAGGAKKKIHNSFLLFCSTLRSRKLTLARKARFETLEGCDGDE